MTHNCVLNYKISVIMPNILNHYPFKLTSNCHNLFHGFGVCVYAVTRVNTHHINAAMLAIMDLVVSDNRAAVCPDLDSRQGITINVVSFDEASAITKNINSTLVAIKNGIAPVFR